MLLEPIAPEFGVEPKGWLPGLVSVDNIKGLVFIVLWQQDITPVNYS